MVEEKKLKCQKLIFFDYTTKSKEIQTNKNADKIIKLDNNILKRKKDIIVKLYGFEKGSFEEKSCKKYESLKILNIKGNLQKKLEDI